MNLGAGNKGLAGKVILKAYPSWTKEAVGRRFRSSGVSVGK